MKEKGKEKKSKVGFDDWAQTNGASAEDAANLPREEVLPSGPYAIRHGKICYLKATAHGTITEALANFAAQIVEETIIDDGAEQTRAFTLAGRLASGPLLPPVRVPVAKFSGMAWVSEQWGKDAIVRAGLSTRDRLREALQTLSPACVRRVVHVHTGWAQRDERWIFLTAGTTEAEVDLGDLGRYHLPSVADDPAGAMRLSLNLLTAKLAPDHVVFPLWASIYRAPTAHVLPIDMVLWIEGPTGSLKSTLVALHLGHYGASFDRLHLSGSWSSTPNALERRLFILKDVVAVIDDYAPTGIDAREYEAKAARVLRGVGNRAARGRLRADLSARPDFVPRGLIVATGEQHPPGQSILARMLCVELDRASVNLEAVSRAQATVARLPHALAGFVEWLAPEIGALELDAAFADLRARASAGQGHLRTPEAIAHLRIGIDMALTYAVTVGACDSTEAADLTRRAEQAFEQLSFAQAAVIQAERPVLRFLTVLLTLVNQGKAVLLDSVLGGDPGRAEVLGWQDAIGLYLMPEAAWGAVLRHSRDASDPFPVRQDRLRRDLVREGLAETSSDGERTVPKRIMGRLHRVLFLRRPAVEKVLGVPFPEPPSPSADTTV